MHDEKSKACNRSKTYKHTDLWACQARRISCKHKQNPTIESTILSRAINQLKGNFHYIVTWCPSRNFLNQFETYPGTRSLFLRSLYNKPRQCDTKPRECVDISHASVKSDIWIDILRSPWTSHYVGALAFVKVLQCASSISMSNSGARTCLMQIPQCHG